MVSTTQQEAMTLTDRLAEALRESVRLMQPMMTIYGPAFDTSEAKKLLSEYDRERDKGEGDAR